jgi:hypothetical protein
MHCLKKMRIPTRRKSPANTYSSSPLCVSKGYGLLTLYMWFNTDKELLVDALRSHHLRNVGTVDFLKVRHIQAVLADFLYVYTYRPEGNDENG